MDTNIIIADDHSMIRKGLKLYMQINLGFTNIAEVSSCSELMKELIKKKFTHLILDIILNDGSTLEIIPNITRVYPNLKIMVFSMQPAEVYGEAMKRYNIENYLSKSAGEEQILQYLKNFLNNESPDPSHNRVLQKNNPFKLLSNRELEILHYVLQGAGTKVIAETLNLKMSTISTLKTRICEKTNANNIKELMELATLYNINF